VNGHPGFEEKQITKISTKRSNEGKWTMIVSNGFVTSLHILGFTTQDILLHVNIKSRYTFACEHQKHITSLHIVQLLPHTEQCVCVHLKCDLHHNCTTVVIYYAILCFCHAAAASSY